MSGTVRIVRFLFVVALGVLVLALFLSAPSGKRFAAKLERFVDRTEHRMLYRLGKPLRGTPDLARYEARLKEKGVAEGAPVFIRIFKQDSELELWLHDGRKFVLFATYPMCFWSGSLGPKLQEGDGQSPEGFYTVSKAQLNPNSRWHRSFNLGFPNVYDRAHGRTGSFLMVHGGCASIGCYAMTDPVVDEIWRLVTAALDDGQPRFAVHAFPFRMTEWNMARYSKKPWNPFWRDLKHGYDLFEETGVPPRVSVCGKRYVSIAGEAGSPGAEAVSENCSER